MSLTNRDKELFFHEEDEREFCLALQKLELNFHFECMSGDEEDSDE